MLRPVEPLPLKEHERVRVTIHPGAEDQQAPDATRRGYGLIRWTGSLEDLYPQIHDIISSVMPAQNLFIALYDEKRNTMRFPYFSAVQDEPYLGEIEPGKGLTAYVLRTGKVVVTSQATSRVSYDIPGQEQRFARQRALRESETRAATVIAEAIKLQMVLGCIGARAVKELCVAGVAVVVAALGLVRAYPGEFGGGV